MIGLNIEILIWDLFFASPLIFVTGSYCQCSNDKIKLCWYHWTYKTIEYEKIKCITISAAVNSTRYGSTPIKDKNKKQKAWMSLCSSDSYGINLRPNAWSGVFGYKRGIYQGFLKFEELKKLLEVTDIRVYITEEMFFLYKKELWNMFVPYGNRVIISCRYDNYSGYKQLFFYELPQYFDAEYLYDFG